MKQIIPHYMGLYGHIKWGLGQFDIVTDAVGQTKYSNLFITFYYAEWLFLHYWVMWEEMALHLNP